MCIRDSSAPCGSFSRPVQAPKSADKRRHAPNGTEERRHMHYASFGRIGLPNTALDGGLGRLRLPRSSR
eukprot:2471266-Alexandrium_andersonii.AAC.1